MKYEIPVCEMLKFNTEDVITTSAEFIGGGDTPVIGAGGSNVNSDNGLGGESN